MQIKWAGYRKLISVCDLYSQSHYSEKSDICGCEICEISAFDMGVAAAYLLVGYKACHEAIRVPRPPMFVPIISAFSLLVKPERSIAHGTLLII